LLIFFLRFGTTKYTKQAVEQITGEKFFYPGASFTDYNDRRSGNEHNRYGPVGLPVREPTEYP